MSTTTPRAPPPKIHQGCPAVVEKLGRGWPLLIQEATKRLKVPTAKEIREASRGAPTESRSRVFTEVCTGSRAPAKMPKRNANTAGLTAFLS